MQPVSQAWLDNQLNPVVTKGFLKLSLYVANTDLYMNTTTCTVADSETDASNPSNLIEEENVTKPQSVLGLNQFVLDGNTDILDSLHEGVYSKRFTRPNDGTQYGNDMVVTIQLDVPTTKKCRNIELVFDENRGYAVSFTITFNTSPATTINVTNNTSTSVNVPLNDIDGFDKITIQLKKWSLPYQKMVLNYVFLGFLKTFSEKDIVSYTARNSVSLDNDTLPTDEIDFEIDNSEGVFDSDPNNTSYENIYKYLSSRQKVVVSYGYEFSGMKEWIKGGTFYLSEWNAPQGGIIASFVAKNNLSFFSQKYTLSANTDLLTLANNLLQMEGISVALRDLDADLANMTTDITDPVTFTIVEGLQKIAQASNKALWCDRDGVIHINDISNLTLDSSYPVDLTNCYSYPEISLDEEVKSVTVGGQTITNTGVSKGNQMQIDNNFIPSGSETTVANYYLALKNKRTNYECSLRIDPRIELLDIVKLTNKNNYEENVIVTGSTVDYNGAFSGKLEVKVWQ